MVIIISSKNNEKTFEQKDVINIGSNPNCDYVMDIGEDFMLTIQTQSSENKFCIVNNFNNNKILFKGQPICSKLEVSDIVKLMVAGSDEYISIKLITQQQAEKTVTKIAQEDFTENDLKGLYGNEVNTVAKVKLEKRKSDLEHARVSIVKQTSSVLNELKKKLSLNFKASLFVHIAMYFSSLVFAFGLSNYLLALKIEETTNFLHLPTNIKALLLFSVIIYGLCLILKQGVYLTLNNQAKKEMPQFIPNFMLGTSLMFFVAIYAINLIYYLQVGRVFAVLISLLFASMSALFAISCGYFKSTGHKLSAEINKYEYREDFEKVINDYNQWIELYCNALSNTKIRIIKDKIFNLQLKSLGEVLLGICTAPFLAYGVSNTLAMCFPEAAGWIRLSGLRFSPVFLVLATFLIIFAFFAFVNVFYSIRKIQASNIIKQDGFSNYLNHGVNILGLEGIRKLELEKIRSLVIGVSIIFIEFTMNTSYFMTEIGGDLSGMLMSLIAASVPTALLIAETYMLSQTKFDIYACEELVAKIDKD